MINYILKIYAFLFARRVFHKLNKFLYLASLRGLGILNCQGEYLTGEKQWLSRYLRSKTDPVVIDVGANVGNYSKNVLNSNVGVIVYAFEPHPITYKRLIENIADPRFNAFNLGVGSENSRLELYDYDSKDGSSHASLYRDVIKDLHKGNPIAHSVEVVSLQNFFLGKNIKYIDLLKIDTEGNEFNVLIGIRSFIEMKKIKAIHFEFNEMNIVSKVSFKDFWDLLVDYDFFRILPSGSLLEIKNYASVFCEIYAFQNIVAILRK